jgi:hypothetical protein
MTGSRNQAGRASLQRILWDRCLLPAHSKPPTVGLQVSDAFTQLSCTQDERAYSHTPNTGEERPKVRFGPIRANDVIKDKLVKLYDSIFYMRS